MCYNNYCEFQFNHKGWQINSLDILPIDSTFEKLVKAGNDIWFQFSKLISAQIQKKRFQLFEKVNRKVIIIIGLTCSKAPIKLIFKTEKSAAPQQIFQISINWIVCWFFICVKITTHTHTHTKLAYALKIYQLWYLFVFYLIDCLVAQNWWNHWVARKSIINCSAYFFGFVKRNEQQKHWKTQKTSKTK